MSYENEETAALVQDFREELQEAKTSELVDFAPALYREASRLLTQLAENGQDKARNKELVLNVHDVSSRIKETMKAIARFRFWVSQLNKTQQFISEIETTNEERKQIEEIASIFRKALIGAKDGQLQEALELLERAGLEYREVVVNKLNKGIISRVKSRVKKAQNHLSPIRFEMLNKRLARIEKLVNASGGDAFDAEAFTESVLSHIVVIEEEINASDVAVGEPTCPENTQAEIRDVVVSVPSPGEMLTRETIHYVMGDEIDISFTRPFCTVISSVSVGTTELGTDATIYDGIEGTSNVPYYYTVVDTEVIENNDRRVTIRVHFPNHADGRTIQVSLSVSTYSGDATETTEITIVEVADVMTDAIMSISEAEFMNDFIVGIYQDYGDDGRNDTGFFTLVDPDYGASKIEIKKAGISFHSEVKVDIPAYCNPTVIASGRFRIVANVASQSFDVVWDDGPNVTLPKLSLCAIPQYIIDPILIGLRIYFTNKAEEEVKQTIQNQVNNAFSNVSPNIFPFIQVIETHPGELRVIVNAPQDNVAIEVPYGLLRLNNADDYGMALNPDESLIAVASNLADVCSLPVDEADCNIHHVGASGLFNWSTNTPIPSPWRLTEFGTYAYYSERHKARKRLTGFRRDETKLPFPEKNVAAFMGRLKTLVQQSETDIFFGTPCAVQTNSIGESRLAFGHNDYRYLEIKEFGKGKVRISVIWLPMSGESNCEQSQSTFDLIDAGMITLEHLLDQ